LEEENKYFEAFWIFVLCTVFFVLSCGLELIGYKIKRRLFKNTFKGMCLLFLERFPHHVRRARIGGVYLISLVLLKDGK